ncbi:MAG: S-layer homology domain-containing protein, partial [Peptococcaceae bacterium]|nr:S-layer homology domain-containing protein [Peptococcaceae bacterium]
MKKAILAVFAAVLVILAGAPAQAVPAGAFPDQFADIEGHWGAAEMKKMVRLGVLQGYPGRDGFYARPEQPVSRAELAAMLARALGLADGAPAPPFADWGGVPGWAAGPLAALYGAGLVRGSADAGGTV